MKPMSVLVETDLIDNCGKLKIELVEDTFAILGDVFALAETSLIYTCRGLICACGALINTYSSPISTSVSLI